MDKWFKILNEKRRKKASRKEPTPFKSRTQKAYKRQRRKNDIYSTVAGHKNLSTGAPYNNKVKRAGTDRLRFEEEVDPASFEKQPHLNSKFWKGEPPRLCKKTANRLLAIVNDFINKLDIDVKI